LERKRRARINRCLDELKDLMVDALEVRGLSFFTVVINIYPTDRAKYQLQANDRGEGGKGEVACKLFDE